MKSPLYLILLSIITLSCSHARNVYDVSLNQALIGKDQISIYNELGAPKKIEFTADGGKIMIYESTSKGMFLTPYRSPLKYDAEPNPTGEPGGWHLTFGEHLAANDPKYTIYPTEVSYLKIYIDKHGKCVKYDQNMTQEQLDIYHERFKYFENSK